MGELEAIAKGVTKNGNQRTFWKKKKRRESVEPGDNLYKISEFYRETRE